MGSLLPSAERGTDQASTAGLYEGFCADLVRSLQGHMYSALDRFGAPLDKDLLRQALSAIQQEVAPGAVCRSLRSLLEQESRTCPDQAEDLAERTAQSLAGALGEVHRTHLGRYLAAVRWRQSPGQTIEAEVRAVGQDLHRKLLPLVRAEARECGTARPAPAVQTAVQAPGQPAVKPTAPASAAPPGHPLLDAFGRGLLSPVELRYPILDQHGQRRGVPGFPRIFCAPVLAEIKFRLIGDDKYEATNAKFIESIRKHCHIEGQLDRMKLGEYFQYPAVRQYLTAYAIHLLKHLMDEDRREIFQANVNARLRKNVTDTAQEFLDMHMAILTSSWALFVFENLESKHRNVAVARILRQYIPGKMEGFGA